MLLLSSTTVQAAEVEPLKSLGPQIPLPNDTCCRASSHKSCQHHLRRRLRLGCQARWSHVCLRGQDTKQLGEATFLGCCSQSHASTQPREEVGDRRGPECPLFFVVSEEEGRPKAIAFKWDTSLALVSRALVSVLGSVTPYQVPVSFSVTVVFKVWSRDPWSRRSWSQNYFPKNIKMFLTLFTLKLSRVYFIGFWFLFLVFKSLASGQWRFPEATQCSDIISAQMDERIVFVLSCGFRISPL